jgi:glycogen debranching enzyme
VVWARTQDRVRVTVDLPGATVTGPDVRAVWHVRLRPGAQTRIAWSVSVEDSGSVVAAAPAGPTWSQPDVAADDRRLAPLLRQSLVDLYGLRMTSPGLPGDVFVAAGAPWFLTLFGRDSLWTARMLLPLGTDLARGTLVALARHQGRREDPATQEQPGKIAHEFRRAVLGGGVLGGGGRPAGGRGGRLPPVYYGTVDATALWVCLLHDAWCWGLADAEVRGLLPALEAALGWLALSAAAGDGFLAYADHRGAGLANQGWKDSGDAVRHADGRLAVPPVALAEVQGYAHEAAICGARLLDAFHRPGGDGWRDWADHLARRFRQAYWVQRCGDRYVAMALDGDRRPVDAVASNMGHLLGTGILDAEESARVARRVVAADLADGYGLRTMSRLAGGYGTQRYHCGTVWPHDTAITIAGLARSGHGNLAGELIEGLLAAGLAFAGRLPELWGGDPRSAAPQPVPYPAACRPQAWSAAAPTAVLTALLGLAPDVPAGRLVARPIRPSPVGAVRVRGLRLAGQALDADLDPDGEIRLRTAARVTVG